MRNIPDGFYAQWGGWSGWSESEEKEEDEVWVNRAQVLQGLVCHGLGSSWVRQKASFKIHCVTIDMYFLGYSGVKGAIYDKAPNLMWS